MTCSRSSWHEKRQEFDEKDAWNNMVCNLAGFYHEVTGQEPTATESEADGCSPSEFVGLVYAVTQQFSLSRQKRWPGKERGGQQAIVKKGNGPPNAMAKAVKRALDEQMNALDWPTPL
jgi:hypothetical protein